MSRKVELPTLSAITEATANMITEAEATGKRPTVTDLARRLGLTNTTFWRIGCCRIRFAISYPSSPGKPISNSTTFGR